MFLGEFHGISQKCLNFAGPRPRKIPEALNMPIIKCYVQGDSLTELNYFRELAIWEIQTVTMST